MFGRVKVRPVQLRQAGLVVCLLVPVLCGVSVQASLVP